MNFIDLLKDLLNTDSAGLAIAMFVVMVLIAIFALIGVGISIFLFFKYHKLNKTKNSIGMTGQDIARKVLDDNGLQKIKIKCAGSILWGNSYSHVWKKIRLRRLTYKKKSVTALAMAVQKSSLAIMDKEGDPIMKARNKLIPLQMFGPLMFLPMVIIGVILDIFLIKSDSYIATFVAAGLGIAFYVLAFVLTGVILKAETAAQAKSIEIMKAEQLATDDEIEKIKELYKLYNLEYINTMILAFLELVLRVLQLIAKLKSGSTTSSN